MKKNLSNNVSMAVLLVAVGFSGAAFAQDSTTQGIAVGDFTLKPSLTTSVEHDDNIYTEKDNTNSDVITRIKPEVTAETRNPARLVRVKLGAEQVLYADDSNDSHTNYDTSIRLRQQPQKGLVWDSTASFSRNHARRGDNEADPGANASEALPNNQYGLKTSLEKKTGAWKVTPRLGVTRYDYENVSRIGGGIVDQEGRDRDEYMVGGRVGYALDKAAELYVDAEYTPQNYDVTGAGQRDSDGGEYLTGLRYRPSKEWLAEGALGYMHREYEDSAYENISALDAHGLLSWTYEEGGQAQLKLARTIAEVTTPGVGGAVRTNVSLNVTKALVDKLSGNAGASYRFMSYEGGGADDGSDREDDYYKLSTGLAYDLTDRAALTADYSYAKNSSNRDQAEYDRNLIRAGLKVGF